jgi:hypothetical protein
MAKVYTDKLKLNTGDFFLLQTGDNLLLQTGSPKGECDARWQGRVETLLEERLPRK